MYLSLSVATIFAYGQTSSGKTFTIRGEEGSEGLISMAINDICKAINDVSLFFVCACMYVLKAFLIYYVHILKLCDGYVRIL